MKPNPNAYSSYLAVQILKTLKTGMDYKILSKQTGIPVSTLTRYVTNKTIPHGKRAAVLIEKLVSNVDIPALVNQRLVLNEDEVDVSQVVSESSLVELIVAYMLREFSGYRIDAVLGVDRAGTVVATGFGLSTMKRVFYAQNTESYASDRWLEIRYKNKQARLVQRLYVPSEALKNHILVSAGVLDSHVPLREIRTHIVSARGELVGVCAIAASQEFLKNIKPFQFGKILSFVTF